MFERFKEEVKALLERLRAEHKLPSELEQPSTARLRDFCLLLLSDGLSMDDKLVMARFFDCRTLDSLENCISNIDIDRLRPLRNYIIGNTTRPTEEITNLLAILIDFQPRPYAIWREQNTSASIDVPSIQVTARVPESKEVSAKTDTTNIKIQDVVDVSDHGTGNIKKRWYNLLKKNKSVTNAIGIATLGIASFWGFKTLSPEECMCWNGHEYIEIDCKSDQAEATIIVADEYLLKNFKKIMRSDTLTSADAYKIWYSKINHRVEFFTASGFHPIHTHKPLKAATPYIIEKYAGKSL